MVFNSADLYKKYRGLGFIDHELGMKASIGGVRIVAVEHPFYGVALFFEHIDCRTATQFEIMVPAACSTEQIAGLIYVNFVETFREKAPLCRRYFERLNVDLFQ